MKFSSKRLADIELLTYFIPKKLKSIPVTEIDLIKFFEWSEQGKHKSEIGSFGNGYEMNGLTVLVFGKKQRDITMEMWEEGIKDGSVPYYTLLGGSEDEEVPHNPIPRSVVEFMKKNMFQGIDSDVIESCYQSLLLETK